VRADIRRAHELTDKPIAANIILPLTEEDDPGINACLEEGISVLVLFFGSVAPYVDRAHSAGTKVVAHVGSVEEARSAEDVGADAIMIQGIEAGGHVRGVDPLLVALPAVVDAVSVPVIASGGVADGRGLASALVMGAQAVSMGTRFLASHESRAAYKDWVVRARSTDTWHTKLFDVEWPDAFHRVLRNTLVEEWEKAGSPASGSRPHEGEILARMPIGGVDGEVVDVPAYSIFMPMEGFEGDLERACLYAGQSCELVNDVRPAGELVAAIAAEAEQALKRVTG
jgi:nitronate monooxygenase/enoyl-[acyl-carrier protein] reductase II